MEFAQILRTNLCFFIEGALNCLPSVYIFALIKNVSMVLYLRSGTLYGSQVRTNAFRLIPSGPCPMIVRDEHMIRCMCHVSLAFHVVWQNLLQISVLQQQDELGILCRSKKDFIDVCEKDVIYQSTTTETPICAQGP